MAASFEDIIKSKYDFYVVMEEAEERLYKGKNGDFRRWLTPLFNLRVGKIILLSTEGNFPRNPGEVVKVPQDAIYTTKYNHQMRKGCILKQIPSDDERTLKEQWRQELDSFWNPVVMSPKQALQSVDDGCRVSICGKIREISEIYKTMTSTHRTIRIGEVPIKLWGPQTELIIPEVGTSVVATSLIATTFRETKEFHGTKSTQFKINQEEEVPFSGTIIGIDFESGLADILINGTEETLNVPKTLLNSIFPTGKLEHRLDVCGSRQGDKIEKIQRRCAGKTEQKKKQKKD